MKESKSEINSIKNSLKSNNNIPKLKSVLKVKINNLF